MRRITLIFALLLSLMGVRQANAGTLTETFDDVTVTSRYLLSNGWVMVHNNGSYQGFGGSYDYQIKSGNYDGGTGYALFCSYSDANEYVVIPTKLTGTFSYYAKRAESSNGTITFFEATKDGDTFTIGSQLATTSTSSSWGDQKSFDLGTSGKYVAIQLIKSRIDQISASTIDEVSGPALMVTGDDNGSLNFGMVNPGDTKELTLMNPGTEAITVSVATTGGFSAASTKTIAAKGEETLAIAAPTTVGASTGKVTITPNPAVEGVNPVEIALSCIIKDPAKFFEDFSGKALPTDWTSTGSWTFTDGYAKTGNNTNIQLTTPPMIFENGEVFAFEAAGCSSWASYGDSYKGKVIVQTSTDGTNFSDLETFSGMDLDAWQSCNVTIPAGIKFVRFVGSYVSIDNIYGGKLDESPRPKLEVEGIANGGSLSWGYSDVPAGSTKTITLKNDGTADLDVTIAATDDYTVDPATATVEAGGTAVVTIGTPAHDGEGVLTITPAEGSGLSPYTISLSSYYKEPKPVMAIDKTSVAFGKVNEVKSETITVSNTGDAELVVAIANDNTTNFTVVPAESLTVAPGETGEITITYNYVEGTWGTFKANVTVTPNYGGTYDVKTITVSATSKDPNVWDEDFEEGMPSNWIADGWTVSTPGSYSGGNGTKMAGGNSRTATLITPRLIATEGQELTFDLGGSGSSYPLTVEYSTDRETWETVATFTEDGTQTIAAPTTTSNFYLRFTGWVYIDNLAGFKLDLPAHDAVITATSIPATGTQFAEYTASVTVKEQAGKSEDMTVNLYVNGEEVAVATETVSANGTATFTLTYVPEEAIENGVAKIVVSYAGGELTTDEVAMSIAPALTLDETAENFISQTGNEAAVVVKYTPKAGWNTICLPFALTNDILTQIFGEGWKAYEFSAYADGALSFKPATMFAAGYPYIVYSEAPVVNEKGFVVKDVNVSASEANADSYGGATFQGTYSPIAAPGMEGKYGVVTSTGKIQKGSAKASLKGLRAYFELPVGTTVKELGISYEDDATGISQFVATPENGAIYDLNGNKVKNLVKGQVYIMNGQKVLIK